MTGFDATMTTRTVALSSHPGKVDDAGRCGAPPVRECDKSKRGTSGFSGESGRTYSRLEPGGSAIGPSDLDSVGRG